MNTWKQIGDAARDVVERIEYPIDFGKLAVPKGEPHWVWRCGCNKCRLLPNNKGLHGPFRTRKAAERHAVQALLLYHNDAEGSA